MSTCSPQQSWPGFLSGRSTSDLRPLLRLCNCRAEFDACIGDPLLSAEDAVLIPAVRHQLEAGYAGA